jgi:hypothetical protein
MTNIERERAKNLVQALLGGASTPDATAFVRTQATTTNRRNAFLTCAEALATGGKGGSGAWAVLVKEFCRGPGASPPPVGATCWPPEVAIEELACLEVHLATLSVTELATVIGWATSLLVARAAP